MNDSSEASSVGKKSSSGLLKTGIIGSAVIALCCFTPILVVTLGILGVGGLTGYLDYVLLPSLFVFIGITFYALTRKQRGGGRTSGRQPTE